MVAASTPVSGANPASASRPECHGGAIGSGTDMKGPRHAHYETSDQTGVRKKSDCEKSWVVEKVGVRKKTTKECRRTDHRGAELPVHCHGVYSVPCRFPPWATRDGVAFRARSVDPPTSRQASLAGRGGAANRSPYSASEQDVTVGAGQAGRAIVGGLRWVRGLHL